MLKIDCSILEGGGQIIRNCIAYSAILKKPIELYNIRGNRTKPGLQLQHATGVDLLRRMTNAEVSGITKDSMQVTFAPRDIKSGVFTAVIPTAGSCTLLSQISLPVALFADGNTCFTLKGGTNVPMSPPAQYLREVLIPTIKRFNNHIDIVLTVEKHGFMPSGGGRLLVSVKPLPLGEKLKPIDLTFRGSITYIEIHLSGICNNTFTKQIEDWADKKQFNLKTNVILVDVNKGQISMTAVLHTDTGLVFGTSVLGGKKTTAERMTSIMEKQIQKIQEDAACVDEYLQDQLIIFMALADKPSQIRCGKITLHTTTAIHFAEQMTGVKFNIQELHDGTNVISTQM